MMTACHLSLYSTYIESDTITQADVRFLISNVDNWYQLVARIAAASATATAATDAAKQR